MSKPTYPLSANNLDALVEYVPSAEHPESIVSKVSLPAGAVFAMITTATPTAVKAYSSVQTSSDCHVELNSALLYMNHSCAPTVDIDTVTMEIRVSSRRDLQVGDHITFFYPSTEWEMDRPFDCWCGSLDCFKTIAGASTLDMEQVRSRNYHINKHILDLLDHSQRIPHSN